MIDLIKDWVLGVAAAAFITGIASSFVPKGKLRRMVSLVCGFIDRRRDAGAFEGL
jgi:hypothetical protein